MDRGTLDCAAWGAVHCMALSLAGTRRVRYAYPRTRRVLLATFALTHKPYGRAALDLDEAHLHRRLGVLGVWPPRDEVEAAALRLDALYLPPQLALVP